MVRSFAPKGRNKTAQGNALGIGPVEVLALKGRNNLPAGNVVGRPYRALLRCVARTQGDALGCHVLAFQAKERFTYNAQMMPALATASQAGERSARCASRRVRRKAMQGTKARGVCHDIGKYASCPGLSTPTPPPPLG